MTDKLFWLANRWALYSTAVLQDLFVLDGAMKGGYGTLVAKTIVSLRRQGVSSRELKSLMSKMGDEDRQRAYQPDEVARA